MATEKFLPQYKNAAGELVDIHFDPAVVGLKANPSEVDTATLSKISIDGTVYKLAGGSSESYGDDDVKTLLSGQTVQAIDLDPSSSHVNAQLVAASDLMMSQSYALYTADDQGKFQSNASGGVYVEDDTDYKMVAVVAEKENLNVVLASHNQRPYYIDLSKEEEPHGQEGIALLSDLIAGEGTITVRQAQIISIDPIVFEPTDDQKAIFNDAMKMTLYVDAEDLDGKRYVMQRQYDESGDKVRYVSVMPYIEQRGSTEMTLGTTTTSLVYDKATERFQVSQFRQLFVDGTAEDGVWKSMTIGDTTATFSTDKDLTRAEVINALGYTPYDSANPNNYITSAGVSYKTVTGALGFIPYSATNPEGYISGITNDMVVSALGYSPYDSSNPNGYITGISKNDVTTALGYTPYSSANPNGFITKTVSNLENYFDKATITEMIGQGLQTKIVATLPTSDIKTNIIYMIPLTDTEGYTQWMFIDGNWEKLGTTNINLTEYAKSADLSDVAKTGSYTSLLDKPDIPTDLGDLTNTAGYIKNDVSNLTNYTKTADLATVARTGSYADLSGKPTIPTSVGSLANDVGYLTAGDLIAVGVSTFPNDANYAKLSDIKALQELDVDEIKEAIAITQNVGTIKGVIPGAGLSGGGETGKVTLSHSNSVIAKTTYGSNETTVVSGGSFIVTDVKYDSEGHITASQDRQITIPVIPDITGMLTENNYADTLDSVYQEKGNYQPAGTYLTPVNVVNDNTGNYVVNVTQTTNGQITVTKGNLPTLSVIEGSTTTPTTDSVTVLKSVAGSGHAITETFVNVPTQKYIDDLVGDINAVLDAINGEVI